MADNIEPRVAVLEQIARDTTTTLADIRTELRDIRTELRMIQGRLGNRVAALTGITSVLGVAIIAILVSQGLLWQQMGRLEGQFAGFGVQLSEIATTLRSRTGG